MHILMLEDETGDVCGIVNFCSDSCHYQWCQDNGENYGGWNGCHETPFTVFCEQCGVVIPGYLEDENGPCECQTNNVVVNRFRSEDGEKCKHGNWIQLPTHLYAWNED